MARKRKRKESNAEDQQAAKDEVSKPPFGRSKAKYKPSPMLWIGIVAALLIWGRLLTVDIPRCYDAFQEKRAVRAAEVSLEAESRTPGLSREEIQAQKLIIDVHEHIGSLELASIYLEVMDELGIRKMCLMGSSEFTLTLDESKGFTGYDRNNEELLKIVNTYPGRFEAWPTVNPLDPDKLAKFKDLVQRGATGLKLYLGHGYLTKKGEYMFHPVAMDDPGMLPLYAYCQEHYIPVCIHVNPFDDGGSGGKPGFAQEFIAVLTAFPDMKIDAPHFILSSIRSQRLEEYLDTFPNLYTDVSFGDFFVEAGLKRISKNPEKYKKLFAKYPDRIMYATDLVLIRSPRQTKEWVRNQHQAYLDMLSKETYTTPAVAGQTLRGLALPAHLLERVLYKNYEAFVAKKPRGTVITREIQWDRMGVKQVERKPGQALPPPKKGSTNKAADDVE